MKKYLKKGWRLFRDCQIFLFQGIQKTLFKKYLKVFFSIASSHLTNFQIRLIQMSENKHTQCQNLQKQIKGLHALLPDSSKFTYSILINLDNPSPRLLKSCLSSACMQTAPIFEILLGSKNQLSSEIVRVIDTFKDLPPERIKVFDFSFQEDLSYNLLAKEASGHYLFFLNQHDWIRPDILYRYEQRLRTCSNSENLAINCFEDRITENEYFIPGIGKKKPPLYFPYIFQPPFNLKGMLISKKIWEKTKGLNKNYPGVEEEDLILRLNLAGATITTLPFCLYTTREKIQKVEAPPNRSIFMESLKEYAQQKHLNWDFEPGYREDSIRAIPQINCIHKIQIIVPFKEQKELTLRCMESIKKQKGMEYRVTAVDNGSQDLSIGEEIKRLGGEVLRFEEPFNYSRLNNLAVNYSKTAQDCDLILFLNNDVELDENALMEMTRWIDQPSIGIVGARLHYPDGLLQHGGVMRNINYLPENMGWEHIENRHTFEEMKETKIHAVVDAVTAACALIKKENFLKVGGFDEIWFPIAFSDTSLAVKLKKLGLHSFYTPYAFGTHHESISRKKSLEDVEGSAWMHKLILE